MVSEMRRWANGTGQVVCEMAILRQLSCPHGDCRHKMAPRITAGEKRRMAIELHVFLESWKVPTHDDWQQAITSIGFPATIQAPFNPRSHTGFQPVTYGGHSTGFEFCVEPANEIIGSYPHVSDRLGKRDICATFRWGGDLNEMSAALAAAAALTKLVDGIYYYPDDDVLYGANEAVQATKKDLNL